MRLAGSPKTTETGAMTGTEDDTGATDQAGETAARYTPFRTLLSIAGFLLFFAAIALSIALIATAPWMRVSPDCSVVCVFANDIKDFF